MPSAYSHFNSIKVRLELSIAVCRFTMSSYFNSIKVRLEPVSRFILSSHHNLFQFHKGAIRPPCNSPLCPTHIFQFHKGAIRTVGSWMLVHPSLLNFNSIKVRLERNMRANFHTQPIFQFHKGAIRTVVQYFKKRKETNFNSIKVRLELKYL